MVLEHGVKNDAKIAPRIVQTVTPKLPKMKAPVIVRGLAGLAQNPPTVKMTIQGLLAGLPPSIALFFFIWEHDRANANVT